MLYQVLYTDRRGAGCVRTIGSADRCVEFLKKLKRPARVVRLPDREQVGEVVHVDDWPGTPDDRRVKWLWWFEYPDA